MAKVKLEMVTKSELARRVGATPQAITNAIRRGQIFGDAITEDGKLVLEIARQQFEFNRTERGRKKNTEVPMKLSWSDISDCSAVVKI